VKFFKQNELCVENFMVFQGSDTSKMSDIENIFACITDNSLEKVSIFACTCGGREKLLISVSLGNNYNWIFTYFQLEPKYQWSHKVD